MEVMTRIKKVFLDIGNLKLKAPSNHHLVRVGLNGPMHTELISRQFGLIRTLNPVHYDENAVAVSYEPWEFYRGPNRELIRASIVVGCFFRFCGVKPKHIATPRRAATRATL